MVKHKRPAFGSGSGVTNCPKQNIWGNGLKGELTVWGGSDARDPARTQ